MSEEMFTSKMVRDLVEYVSTNASVTVDRSIEKWIAQNPITPKVVGISAEQVTSLALYLSNGENRLLESAIRDWLGTQTFDNVAASKDLLEALKGLEIAATFKSKTVMFNDVECYEARIPIGFVDDARAAIAKETHM